MRADKVAISYGRMRVFLAFEADEQRYTNANIAKASLAVFPTLKAHSCINSEGPTFGYVIEHTSLAHLLEHLMIAEQSRIADEKGIREATFVGVTHWIDEGLGLAEVQVSFIDDLDAVKALSKSLQFINAL